MDSAFAISQIDYSGGNLLAVIVALAVFIGAMFLIGKSDQLTSVLTLGFAATCVFGVGFLFGSIIDRAPSSNAPVFCGAVLLFVVVAYLRKRHGTPFGTRWI